MPTLEAAHGSLAIVEVAAQLTISGPAEDMLAEAILAGRGRLNATAVIRRAAQVVKGAQYVPINRKHVLPIKRLRWK